MNEKIKELGKQAGLNFGTNISGVELVYGTFEGSVISHIDSNELEKFAELIVRECITAIKNDDGYHLTPSTFDDRYNQGLQMGLEFAITDIAEHFGIEE